MGQGSSCASTEEDRRFFLGVELGEVELVAEAIDRDPDNLHRRTGFARRTALHVAASNGRLEVVSMLLDRLVHPDILDRRRKTPLMLAATHGKLACTETLIHAGANILMFDSKNGRTCLHHAAYHGHLDCLQAILSAARSSGPLAESWGFDRFINVRDDKGATPLHLAARKRRSACVHALLKEGALVGSLTGTYGFPGSTALHLAARAGSLDCVRALLAWGADRLQRDSSERIAYTIAHRRSYFSCAALLDPESPEPIVWPSALKFISELSVEAKALLERALMEANVSREKSTSEGVGASKSSHTHCGDVVHEDSIEEGDMEVCCICFDQRCSMEVRSCGHQMCASCILALCCHSKPNPKTLVLPTPVCPFCRSNIAQLVVARRKTSDGSGISEMWRPRRSHTWSGGNSSFKSLASSFGKLGRGSGRISDSSEIINSPS